MNNKKFRKDNPDYFDYKDVKTMQRYLNIYAQIEPAAKTGLNAKQQKRLTTAVKRARHLALLPFVANN
jgi:small subunit ribosomal protein S18